MTDEELIEMGNDSEVILGSRAFSRTVDKLVDSTMQNFLNSTTDQSEKREQYYRHYRALVDIVATLKQHVAVRDEIHAKTKENEE
tara:strand:- start:4286 stop:4540 length:255 start_codon:yes stop_codon:yes gene_type:complete